MDRPGRSRRRADAVSGRIRSPARHSDAEGESMSEFFGPLDSGGRVPPRQQTRVGAFLVSAHGALARQFAFALPIKLESAWQTELNAQYHRESEIVSVLFRATTWVPDFALGYMAASWEATWFPAPAEGIAD